jgi:tight adherence protein B
VRRALSTGILAVVVLVAAGRAVAQDAPAPLTLGPVEVATYPDLSVVLTAPPALGGEEIAPTSVTVSEGGVAQPSTLVRLPNDRLEVVLVIDTSGSMKGAAFESAKVAASAFIARLPLDARVALVAFGDAPTLASPLVDDRNLLLGAIQGLRARGETALYDAVALATQQFSGDPESRRAIVVLSDGGDTASSVDLDAAMAAVSASGSRLDVVQLVTAETDRAALDRLTSAGAGGVVPADDPAALAGIYDAMAASLANEYVLSWRSTSHGTTAVAIRVEQGGVVAESTLTLDYPPPPPPTAGPSPATVPEATTTGERALFGDRAVRHAGWMLVLGTSCLAAAMFVLGLHAFAPHRGRRLRLSRLGSLRPGLPDPGTLGELVGRATATADAALERHGRRRALNDRLERAGIALRPGEYVVIALSATSVGFAAGLVLAGALFGLFLAALAAVVVHLVPGLMADRRRARFSEQLPDTLQLLAGSLRAGYGLLQAIETVGRESVEPTSGEFRRLVVEARLGREVSQSLAAMARRIGSDDFGWVVQAIDIHREVGGDLAEVLDTVAATIRERNQVIRQVRTLTAEGRLSAYILTALPIVLAFALRLINPGYFELLTFGPGLWISVTAVALLVVGGLWFRKLCQLVY